MPPSKQSFKKCFEELEEIVEKFEAGDLDLEEGMQLFERGLALAAALKKRLGQFENQIEVIKKKFGDSAAAD